MASMVVHRSCNTIQSILARLTLFSQVRCSAAYTGERWQGGLAAARELQNLDAGKSRVKGLHTSVLMLTWRRICRSVLTSMEGSRCTPTQTPFTKIFVACTQTLTALTSHTTPMSLPSTPPHRILQVAPLMHFTSMLICQQGGCGTRPSHGMRRRAEQRFGAAQTSRMTLGLISSRVSIAHSSRNSCTGPEAHPVDT